MQIQSLNQDTINQISAGEVLERPANLVKELVENSLDANADEIIIDYDNGGRWIKIKDNGIGIAPEELPLALSRHATSKIKKFSDLWSLTTFGFRGEALASVAAVSQLTLKTRRQQDKEAHQISSDFGKMSEVIALGGEYGTEIVVKNLFENVPARLKFLKSEGAEVTQILKVIRALALANPRVTFKIMTKGQIKYLYIKTNSYTERARQVLEINELFETSYADEVFKLRILFSSPNDVVNSNQNIWIFVQGRWIQDRGIVRAVLDAYQNLLMHGEYPYCIVYLECDPQIIDVNIHPTKSQVKFSNPSEIFRLVLGNTKRALEKAPWLNTIFNKNPEEREVQEAVESYSSSLLQDSAFDVTSFKRKSHLFTSTENHINPSQTRMDNATIQKYWGDLQVLGQANLTYILAQSRYSLLLVDQHAAHERVVFERLMRDWKNNAAEVQDLLIPININLEPNLMESLLIQKDTLKRAGIFLDQSGPESLFVTSIPALTKESSVVEALNKIARDSSEYGGSYALEKTIGDVFASMACHSVVRAGQSLSVDEMKELLVQMDEFPLSSFCPHGRPVYKEITFQELDREFGRIL